MKTTFTSSHAKRELAVLSVIAYGLSIGPAYAYVDPGSASLIITAILGAIAAVGYTFRSYMERLKSFFRRNSDNQGEKK